MKTPRKNSGIEIRQCHTLEEFEACVGIQHRIWGGDQVVPVPLFVVAKHTGGQVLGAFQQGRMIGFILAFAGVRDEYYLHSHMAAVLPEYRDQGIGRLLKLAQREDALARGIRLIEWTFDPMEAKNAYLNLNKLGAIARRLIPNCYGVTQSPLHHGLPTHRLVAEWWLASERVTGIVSAKPAKMVPPKGAKRVLLPKAWESLRTADRSAAAKAQSEVRQRLEKLFAEGYAAVDILRKDGKVEYLLVPASEITGLKIQANGKASAKSKERRARRGESGG